MKALCSVYDKPWLRFTPNHCDHFLHLELSEDIYPHGISADGVGWGWFVLYFDGVWKILPECGFFLEDSAVHQAVENRQAVIIPQDWRHPAAGTSFSKVHILVDRSRKRPYVFDKHFWKGECMRCGTCCSVPRRRTGKPCEYLKFIDEA
jgi:hypothetical protein